MRSRNRRSAAALLAIAAVVAFPSGVLAYRAYRDHTRRTSMADFTFDPADPERSWTERARALAPDGDDDVEIDDPRWRMLLSRALWGDPTPEALAQKARIAHQEAEKWADLMPSTAAVSSAASPSGDAMAPSFGPISSGTALSWVNLGPADAAFEWNGSTAGTYYQVDSGRAAGILVDPTDSSGDTVYLATSGGGVWKTFDFSSGTPTWYPITETLGNLAIGAMDLDALQPQTLHVGVGDFYQQPGGFVVKTTNGGASWSAPVVLSGTYPPGSGSFAASAKSVRAVKVDPTNSNDILVTTDVGLFRSTDGGNSYALVDLPNSGTQLAEATWSIAYAGVTSGQTRWVVTGVYACAQGVAPPIPGYGVAANPSSCVGGNLGDVWLSTDSGATWTSRRAAVGLASTNVGRLTVAAGAPKANPANTILYIQAEITDETVGGNMGAGIWRSTGGSSWSIATGTLANPTNTGDCATVNVNDSNAWYNSTLAVDPTNDAHVLVGGMLCGLRTLNGTAGNPTWENVSHWLPGNGGDVGTGKNAYLLPYVHADWHRTLLASIGGTLRAFAGTDGGLAYSDNLFTAASPGGVTWTFRNRGIVTHLAYSIATGDPANGNPSIAFTGLQDNGIRFRDSSANPTTFNQVVGGDGFGVAASYDPGSGTSVYYGAQYLAPRRLRCVPGSGNSSCDQGGAWTTLTVPAVSSCGGYADKEPVNTRYAVSRPSSVAHTVLTITDYGVYKATGTGGSFSTIGSCFLPGGVAYANRIIEAADTLDGVYGAALGGGYFAVTSNCPGASTACTWSNTTPIGVDLNSSGTLENNERVLYTSSIAFPPGPTGRAAGQDFVVASEAPVMADNSVLNPAVGLSFRTTNGGATWTPLHGNGTGYDLPLVPIHVVRYDPSDTANNTLYAGTDLGVYRTTDGGLTWRRFGYGLPLVRVTGMVVGRNGQILRVSTFGRGLWELYPSATAEHGVSGDGDYDRDLQLDFIDLAAMASRIGTSPATPAQPLYDWNMDMTTEAPPNNYNAINDNDLTLFLSRFGGRP